MKFKDAGTGLDCDLNVNERLGILNSDMIKEYCALSPMLRPLLFRIKEWAKPLGLNMPTGALGVPASFSSYALALMTIAFLQVRTRTLFFVFSYTYTRNGVFCQICSTICRHWSRRIVRHWCGHGSRTKDGMRDLAGISSRAGSPTWMSRRCCATGSGALGHPLLAVCLIFAQALGDVPI